MSTLILPPAYREYYLQAPVGDHLIAPANPEAGELRLNELQDPNDIQELADVQLLDEGTGMALINKQFPHAHRELMWMHAEDTPIATLHDYFKDDLGRATGLFGQLAACAMAAESDGSYVSVSWSNDPQTHHRASIQGEKRLHFHLTARDEELRDLPDIVKPIGALAFVQRRRLAEEFAVIGKTLLTDYVEAHDLPYELREVHPCVLALEIGDWSDLGKTETIKKVADFINLLETQYQNLAAKIGRESVKGLFLTDRRVAHEPRILEALELDQESCGVQMLAHFLRETRPWCNEGIIERVEHLTGSGEYLSGERKHLHTAVVPLRGLAYAASFARKDGTLHLNFRLCKFSDLGGAGCAIIEGMPVRVKKGSELMTASQIGQRSDFINGLVDVAHKTPISS